jgi:hypothetical protein
VANGFASRQAAECFFAGIDPMPRVVDARASFVCTEACGRVESLLRSAREMYRERADAK